VSIPVPTIGKKFDKAKTSAPTEAAKMEPMVGGAAPAPKKMPESDSEDVVGYGAAPSARPTKVLRDRKESSGEKEVFMNADRTGPGKKMEEILDDKMPGIEVSGAADFAIAKAGSSRTEISKPAPAAGVLTAGEWSDLDNWNKHWRDLLADGEISGHQTTYGLYTNRRYTVQLTNEQGFPCIDVPVTLSDGAGVVQWQAHTDNTGKAELWYAIDKQEVTAGELSAAVILDGREKVLGIVQPFDKVGANRFTLQRSCQAPKLLDIMWAVDATGSMGDEISYLKTELLDVIKRVQRTNQGLTVRMGATFYRDNTDAYLVKSSGLSPNIEQTISYIQEQYADGGGDMPEAVDYALEEVVERQKWSDDAVARICFLILDASPHQTPESNERIQRCIREAARKGIRIVPVSASGIEKDTEFLMKFFGLATNGSYVFLTDHSGVGNKHLEPTTDSYKVEAFNDLLVRLINQYASIPTCDGQTLLQFEPVANTQQQQQQTELPEPARYFPTPATNVLHVVLPVDATKIALYDSEGAVVYTVGQTAAGQHDIPVNNLPAGYYALRIWAHGQVQTGKVVVVRM
jgi:hypothetical protein